MRENFLIEWLRTQTRDSDVLTLGIGDDAAVMSPQSSESVVTTDLICEGTHFITAQCTPQQIGRKAMAVNLSDIAAMAAIPKIAFVSVALPRDTNESFAELLMTAMIDLAREFDCEVAGGDTNVWGGGLAINVLIIGQTTRRGPLYRKNALAGDALLVTGDLGGSIAGKHFDFTPRISEALYLHQHYDLHACMDLSDGLAADVRKLGAASGCGAEMDASSIPISAAAEQLASPARSGLDRALGDGEDFELLFTASPEEAKRIVADQPLDVPITQVGTCLSASSFWLRQNGSRINLPVLGYEHGNDT